MSGDRSQEEYYYVTVDLTWWLISPQRTCARGF